VDRRVTRTTKPAIRPIKTSSNPSGNNTGNPGMMRGKIIEMDSVAHGKFAGKTLVVFGAGYVGGEVARQGVALGMRVTALTRNAGQAQKLETSGVKTIIAELASNEWHGKIGAADFVVNCVSAGGGGMAGYRGSYVEGMRSLVAWLQGRGKGAKTFVYTSSTSVYPQTGGVIVREEDEVDGAGGDERTRLLIEAEHLALGNGACVLRLAGIYGPGRHALADQMRAGAAVLPGRADSRLNLIHRDDAAAAIWAVLASDKAHGEIFNVCDDAPCPRGEIADWLAQRLAVPAPAFSGDAARRGSGRLNRIISNEKLKTRAGWRPRFAHFREGYAALPGGRA
jgi:nucleoside-diphosphate-sugar epimerase